MRRSLLTLLALLALATPSIGSSQQQAQGSVLVNQMRIPVKFQILDPSTDMLDNKAMASGDSTIVRPGCLRFSTGKPAKIFYYVLELEHRYAFRAKGHTIVLVQTASDGHAVDQPTYSVATCKNAYARAHIRPIH